MPWKGPWKGCSRILPSWLANLAFRLIQHWLPHKQTARQHCKATIPFTSAGMLLVRMMWPSKVKIKVTWKAQTSRRCWRWTSLWSLWCRSCLKLPSCWMRACSMSMKLAALVPKSPKSLDADKENTVGFAPLHPKISCSSLKRIWTGEVKAWANFKLLPG